MKFVKFWFQDSFIISLAHFVEFSFLETKHGATLKIIKLSKVSGSVEGGDEVWLLADKLNCKCNVLYIVFDVC